MSERSDIQRELEKNRFDRVACEIELENAKKNTANELLKDIENYQISNFITPQKIKKPFKMRLKQKLKRFFNNIINTLS